MQQNNNLELIYSIYQKNLTQNNFINFIIIISRLIPVIIITHDLNILYSNSLSYYISIITLNPLIQKGNSHKISEYAVYVIFFITLLSFFIILYYIKKIKRFGISFHSRFLKYVIKIQFWLNFILSPYVFMLCFDNFFCNVEYDKEVEYKLIKKYKDDCRNIENIIIVFFSAILFIFNIISNIFFSILISIPISYTTNIIVAKLKELKIQLSLFPIFQAFLLFDYHLPLKYTIMIKSFIRLIFIIYYIILFLTEIKSFYTNSKVFIFTLFVYSMCFISCIIEYFGLLDYKNNYIYLQKNGTIIVFKIVFEISVSFVLIELFKNIEKKYVLELFINGTINKDLPYELLNKIFHILHYLDKKFGDDLLYLMLENFSKFFKKHKEEKKCKKLYGINCYCKNYEYNDFLKQSDEYLNIVNILRNNGIMPKYKILKNKFPLLFKFLEHFIRTEINKFKGNKIQANYILALVIFYIIFDKNYNKSFFYFEEFQNSKFYKSSILVKLQCISIKNLLLEDYKYHLIYEPERNANITNITKVNENSFQEIYKFYIDLMIKIQIENNLIEIINGFIDDLNYFKDKDCSLIDIEKLMENFLVKFNFLNKILFLNYNKKLLTSYHICSKLTLFHSFFFNEIPKKYSLCYKNIFESNCSFDNFSTILLNIYNNKDSWKFILEYASDDFCSKIGHKLSEIKDSEFNELFPQSLKNCFEFLILKKIRSGNIQIVLREIVIIDKFNYANLFDMIGIVIYTGDGLKLFIKVFPYSFKEVKNLVNNTKHYKNYIVQEREKKLKKLKHSKDGCFVFTNKNGKVIAINQQFEKYFCMNLNNLKKYKINFFKDILKIEKPEEKDIIKKNLNLVYENIIELNFGLMQNSSNEEFTKSYKLLKEIQSKIIKNNNNNLNYKAELICNLEERELLKNEKSIKNYYFIYMNIEFENNIVSLESFFNSLQQIKHNNLDYKNMIASKTCIGEVINYLKKSSNKSALSKFEINKNNNDTLTKIRQIQILSIKQLLLNYNINTKNIFDFSKKEEFEFNLYNNFVERDIQRMNKKYQNNSTFNNINSSFNNNIFINNNNGNFGQQNLSLDNYDKMFHFSEENKTNAILKKKNLNQKLKLKIYIQIFIWIFFSILFTIFQFLIIYLEKFHNKKISRLNHILITSLIIRNIVHSIVSSLLRLQYIANDLQNESLIDYNFNNSQTFHKNKVYERINDYLYYFKTFEKKEKFLFDYNKQDIISIFQEEFNYISVKSENLMVQNSLYTTLNTLHLNTKDSIDNEILPFLFNISSYYEIENRLLLDKSAFFQFVADNYLTFEKYAWDEVDNLIIYHINKDSKKSIKNIYIINILNGILLFVIFIFQSFFYNKLNNIIYVKYYIIYNYLQFFNSLLLKKTNQIKNFFENNNYENLYKFKTNKIEFLNKNEDNLSFKKNYLRINNHLPLLIKPYKINEFVIEEKNDFLNTVINGTIRMNNLHLNTVNYNNNNNNSNIESNSQKNDNISKSKTRKDISKKASPKKLGKSTFKGFNSSNLTLNSNYLNVNSNSKNLLTPNSSSLSTVNSSENNQNEIINDFLSIENQYHKKDLSKPNQFLKYLIVFSISCLSILIFCFCDSVLINYSTNKQINFSKMIHEIIGTCNTAQEIFLMWMIILLKNEKIIFTYYSHGYLNNFEELAYINDITEHDILHESLTKYNLFNTKVYDKLFEYKNDFKVLSTYVSNLNKDNSCEYYVNFYEENKDILEKLEFEEINCFSLYDKNDIINECKNISNGINLKGIRTAIDSLVNTINTYYNEFKQDTNKNEEHMINRVNNVNFISTEMETDLILDKLIINYVLSWKKDFDKINKRNVKFSNLFFILILVLILIILICYLLFFPFNALKQNKIIMKIEPCLYNTIMF